MMFGNNKKQKAVRIDSLIGEKTELHGDLFFNGGLHVDGKIKGNVRSHEEQSLLTLSDNGVIEGEVHVPNVILNGTVKGDVYTSGRVELASGARITGNVYYNLIEMAIGAEVNGNLLHQVETESAEPVALPLCQEGSS